MSVDRVLRLATRSSPQARTQASAVAEALAASGHPCELVFVDTEGDRSQSAGTPLHTIGGRGVFTKEVQRAVLDGRADLAVHSAKDLPTEGVDELAVAAWTARRDPRDALIGRSLDDLAEGATVATGSVRRRAQLAERRPDLTFIELRGNIGTRLERIPAEGAIVMAVAALEVLGLTDRIAEVLDPMRFVPAVGQGCVAVECRSDDEEARSALSAVDHEPTARAVTIERAFLAELGSGCSLPLGAHVSGGTLHSFLAGADGAVDLRSTSIEAPDRSPVDIARDTARESLAAVGSW
ncbi:MAG: hydroxymethylbilane synthase [Ilumatobacteraceae bacterium]